MKKDMGMQEETMEGSDAGMDDEMKNAVGTVRSYHDMLNEKPEMHAKAMKHYEKNKHKKHGKKKVKSLQDLKDIANSHEDTSYGGEKIV
jgi:hypothetical protein